MTTYTDNESYKHKYAKQVFKEWCDSGFWIDNHPEVQSVKTNDVYDYRDIRWKNWRDENAWLEYPIVVDKGFNSVKYLWDEIWDEDDTPTSFVPTFQQCKEKHLHVTSIVDVVIPSLGSPQFMIEICHTNPVSDEKVEKLKKLGVHTLIEIDAEWILRQTKQPSTLKIKRWLI